MIAGASTSVEAYRARAVDAVRRVVQVLAGRGVDALVTGSLAKGGFGAHSDVDLLVTSCPRHLKYAIEGIVEDTLGGIPFDLVYLDELPVWRVASFTNGAIDASDLC